MLARLAELDLAAAEKAHAKFMAAEEPDDIDRLGRTYQRLSRSLRQTLALKARLAREADVHRIRTTPMVLTPRQSEIQRLTPAVRAHIDKAAAVALRYLERERETADYGPIGEIEIYEILEDLAREADFLDRGPDDLAAAVLDILSAIFDDDDAADASAPPADVQAPAPALQDSA